MRRCFYLSVIIISIMLTSLPACVNTGSASPVPEPDYAAAITESLLLAINDNDFSRFSQDFSDAMKKTVTPEVFNSQFILGIKDKIGDYQASSKRFFSASSQSPYIAVTYAAIYIDEPGAVLVQVSFQQVEGKPLVTGMVFNSPKLRG
jgi:hypothetical protein